MATYAEELSFSSPDPLAVSMLRSSPGISLSPSKPTRLDLASPSRKQTSVAAASVGFSLLDTPAALRSQPHSPIRTTLPVPDNISPWRIHVTVEAERNETQRSPSPQKRSTASPTRVLLADTRTTVVPLRGGDDEEPSSAPKRKRGRPRKNATPARRQPTPNPKRARTTQANKKLLELAEKNSQSMMLEADEQNADVQVVDAQAQADASNLENQTSSTQPAMATNPKRFSDILAQHNGFDSVMEAEDFTMLTLSTLPSAKHLSALSSTKNIANPTSNREISSADTISQQSAAVSGSPTKPFETNTIKRRHDLTRLAELSAKAANTSFRTPSSESQPLHQPGPPEPRVSSSPRALETSERNRSSLSSVQKVAGVLNHAISHKSPSLLSSPAKLRAATAISKTSVSTSGNGFGIGTQRELYAGLRLGEELAKQYPEISNHTLRNAAKAASQELRSSVNRYKLPTPEGDTNSSLSESTSRHSLFVAASRTHLPSPQDSEREDSGNGPDLMDWQHDTVRQPSAARAATTGTIVMRDASDLPPPAAVSQSIRMTDAPNEADVDLWLSLDGAADAPTNATQLASPDIWQAEAQNSSMVSMTRDTGASKRSPVDVLPKPRRSKLPRTWRKTSGLIYSDEVTASSPLVQPTMTALTFSADMAGDSSMETDQLPVPAQEVTPIVGGSKRLNADYSVLSNIGMRGTAKKRPVKTLEPNQPSPKKRKIAEDNLFGSKSAALKPTTAQMVSPRKSLLNTSLRRPLASRTPLFKPRTRAAPLFASVKRTFSGKVTDLVGTLQKTDLSSSSVPETAKAPSVPSWTEAIADAVKPAFTFSVPFTFKSLPKPDLRALPSKLYTMVKPATAPAPVKFYRGESPPQSDKDESALSDHLPFTSSHYKHLSSLYQAAKSSRDAPSSSTPQSITKHEDVEKLRGLWFQGNGWAKKLEDWEFSVIPGFLESLHSDENSSMEKIDAKEVAVRIMSLWAGEVQRGETKLGADQMAGLFEERYAARRDAILAGVN